MMTRKIRLLGCTSTTLCVQEVSQSDPLTVCRPRDCCDVWVRRSISVPPARSSVVRAKERWSRQSPSMWSIRTPQALVPEAQLADDGQARGVLGPDVDLDPVQAELADRVVGDEGESGRDDALARPLPGPPSSRRCRTGTTP